MALVARLRDSSVRKSMDLLPSTSLFLYPSPWSQRRLTRTSLPLLSMECIMTGARSNRVFMYLLIAASALSAFFPTATSASSVSGILWTISP